MSSLGNIALSPRGGVRIAQVSRIGTIDGREKSAVEAVPDTGEWPTKGQRHPLAPGEGLSWGEDEVSRSCTLATSALGSETVSAALLSTVAGYVDTAGFLALFGIFTAHVTGDLIMGAAAVSTQSVVGVGTRLAMIPIFMVTVASVALLSRSARRRRMPTITPLLALMTATLALFCVLGVLLRPGEHKAEVWSLTVVAAVGVVAMGIQNTLMRDTLRKFTQTTIMTGNLTQFTIDLVTLVFPASESPGACPRQVRRDAVRRLQRTGLPLLGFMTGASLGAWLTRLVGLGSIALPTLGAGTMTVLVWRRGRQAQGQRVRGSERRQGAVPIPLRRQAPSDERQAMRA